MEGLFARYADQLTPEQLAALRASVDAMPVHPVWLALFQGMVAGVTVNALVALGEEIGWRGFLVHHLGARGFWSSSLAIGALWGLWHAPLILQGHNFPDHPVAGVGVMVLFCVASSPVFQWIRGRAGTVLAAAVVHGTLNGTAGAAILVVAGGTDLTVGAVALAGVSAWGLASLALALALRGREPQLADPPPTDADAPRG